jgi:multisubunit Na+/H+ antiporter MnhC subunit
LSEESDPSIVFRTLAHDISSHDGRVYSGVGPGASVAAVPFYAAFAPVFAVFDEGVVTNRRIVNYYAPNARALEISPANHFKDLYLLQILMVIAVVAPLFASFLTRLHGVLIECGTDRAQAAAVAVAAGLGTMGLYYASMYSRQALAYLLVWHAVLWFADRRPARGSTCVVVGVFCGAAIAIEYQSALLVGLLLLWRAPHLSWRQRSFIAMPLLSVLGLLALYHDAAFGSPFATAYQHRFWYTHPALLERGIDLSTFQPATSLGMNPPSPAVMFWLCFGLYKGLFVYSPILLLGLIGHLAGLRNGPVRSLHAFSLLVFLVYLVFNSTLGTHLPEYGRHYWGGLSGLWGPRYLFAVLPFLAWGLVRLDWSRAGVRLTCGIALAVSCVNSLLGAMYSHTIMSTFAFGDELRHPLAYAYALLLERGPRITLLDRQGVDPLVQALVLVALLVISSVLLRRILRDPAQAGDVA